MLEGRARAVRTCAACKLRATPKACAQARSLMDGAPSSQVSCSMHAWEPAAAWPAPAHALELLCALRPCGDLTWCGRASWTAEQSGWTHACADRQPTPGRAAGCEAQFL